MPVAAGRPRSPGPAALGDPVVLAYLAAVLLALVQAAVLGAPGRTLAAAVPYLLALLVVVALRATGPADPEAPEPWLTVVAGAGMLLAVWLLGAFVGALPAASGVPDGFYRVKVAVTSPVGDHNTAAGLLLPAVVAAAVLAARDARWRAGLAVTTLGLVATLSRGAAGVLLAVGVAGLALASTRRVKVLLLAAGGVAVAGVLALAAVLGASPGAAAPPDANGLLGASVLGRLDLAARGVRVGLEHPVLGVGLGGFAEVAGDLPAPNDHAHQLLAHTLAEGGLVLLAAGVTVPVVLAVRARRLPRGPLRDLVLLGGAGLVAHAQIEILAGRAGYEVLLALLAGLAGPAALRCGPPAPEEP